MEGTNRLHELRESDRMQWLDGARGWRAEPDDVVNALAADGFQECKRETARIPLRTLMTRRNCVALSPQDSARLLHGEKRDHLGLLDASGRKRLLQIAERHVSIPKFVQHH